MSNKAEQTLIAQLDDEISRLERDYAHRDAYGDAGPKLKQLLKTIAILRRKREALAGPPQH
jgi:hypothetical protein